MGLDNLATDGQSHSGALRLGGKERLEDALGFLNWKPDA
jgi:hypothetical protein